MTEMFEKGCVCSLLQGDIKSNRLLRDRQAAILKGKLNTCYRSRGFRGSVLSCLLPATTQTFLSAAVMLHLEWLELCDLLCSSLIPFEFSSISLGF